MPLLRGLKHLNINVAGEVFVSKPSRQILSMISPETCPELEIDIISNGMLFTPKEWEKFPGIHGKVSGVRISIDAARKETFESLRRFGIHEVLLENLKFLHSLRRSGQIGGLTFSFTYQRDNFREMQEFVEFGRAYGADKINFEPLQNVGAFTEEEYRVRAVHKSDHRLYPEFLAMIRRPIFKTQNIQHDFANHDFEAFSRTDVLLSQDFHPAADNCRLEGVTAGVKGSSSRPLPKNGTASWSLIVWPIRVTTASNSTPSCLTGIKSALSWPRLTKAHMADCTLMSPTGLSHPPTP